MNLSQAQKIESKCFSQVFGRLPVLLVKGKGMYVYDDTGRRYIDMFAGVAVSAVGHSHPRVVKAICEQASRLVHVSNWVYNEPQLQLAKKLVRTTGMERVFFTNDGSGAVETAIKLARKHTGKKGIIAMENSFHGRSMGALSATWTQKYRKPFEPLLPGFSFVKYNDITALKNAINEETAAVIVEPIQGEAGVLVPDDDYINEVRELTQRKGVVMIADEIQTGFGRTGRWFDYQRAGIKPDIVCMAKGLGGGFPIGGVAFQGMDFEKGQQGGTYNGGPLACAAANAVLDVIKREKLVQNAAKTGGYLMKRLSGGNPRGRGLMIGLDVDDGKRRALEMMQRNVIAIFSGNTLRILPPLVINRQHADIVIDTIEEVLDARRGN